MHGIVRRFLCDPSICFVHVTSIHPAGMLDELVILTLIEHVGRKPLTSTYFSHQGSAYA